MDIARRTDAGSIAVDEVLWLSPPVSSQRSD